MQAMHIKKPKLQHWPTRVNFPYHSGSMVAMVLDFDRTPQVLPDLWVVYSGLSPICSYHPNAPWCWNIDIILTYIYPTIFLPNVGQHTKTMANKYMERHARRPGGTRLGSNGPQWSWSVNNFVIGRVMLNYLTGQERLCNPFVMLVTIFCLIHRCFHLHWYFSVLLRDTRVNNSHEQGVKI